MASLKDLVSYKLRKVADLLGRSAAIRYKRLFGVSLLEWRTLALIGEFAPVSLNELADHAALDKSQLSRVIASLRERGLVDRGRSEVDGRGVALSLTRRGQRVCDELIAEADGRDRIFLGALTPAECKSLESVIQKLTRTGKDLMLAEQQINAGQSRSARRPVAGK